MQIHPVSYTTLLRSNPYSSQRSQSSNSCIKRYVTPASRHASSASRHPCHGSGVTPSTASRQWNRAWTQGRDPSRPRHGSGPRLHRIRRLTSCRRQRLQKLRDSPYLAPDLVRLLPRVPSWPSATRLFLDPPPLAASSRVPCDSVPID